MALNYDSEFIFIGRGDENFLENYSYELSDDPEGQGGKIFMALELLNNQAEAEDIGEAIFSNFKQKFYEDLGADPYERFESALKIANETIETLKEEKVSHFIGNLNVAIGAVVDSTLYISVTGDAEVYLVRKRFVSILSEDLAEESKKATFINIANGTLESSDSIVFSSSRLLRYITKSELGKIFSESSIGKALINLQDFVMTEILGRSAVIGIRARELALSEEEVSGGMFEGEQKSGLAGRFSGWFGSFVGSAGDLWKKMVARLKMPVFFKKREQDFSYEDEEVEKPSRAREASKLPKIRFHAHMTKERIMLAAIVLLIVLVGGVFWIKTRGDQNEMVQALEAKLNHVRESLNNAVTFGQFEKTKAAELLTVAEKEAVEVLNSRFLRGEAVKLLDEIQDARDDLDEVKRIENPTLLADFSEKRENVSALGLLNLKDRLFGFEYNALYEIILDKLQQPLKIDDTETVILGASNPEKNSLLFLTRTGKLIEYNGANFNFVSTKDGVWRKGVDIKTYNGRVYILDSERNQIWRYSPQRDTFDAAVGYNQNAELNKGVSLAIDSSVYVLNSDATITQLYQGQKQNYPLRKAPMTPVTEPTKIYTTEALNYLFILEPSKQRVIVFKKDAKNGGAQYQMQYVFEKTGVLRDLVVFENRLYVMDDKRVYFVNLSGL